MVRIKNEWKTITISKNMYDWLDWHRKHFESTISAETNEKWSLNDSLVELSKILKQFKEAGGFENMKK